MSATLGLPVPSARRRYGAMCDRYQRENLDDAARLRPVPIRTALAVENLVGREGLRSALGTLAVQVARDALRDELVCTLHDRDEHDGMARLCYLVRDLQAQARLANRRRRADEVQARHEPASEPMIELAEPRGHRVHRILVEADPAQHVARPLHAQVPQRLMVAAEQLLAPGLHRLFVGACDVHAELDRLDAARLGGVFCAAVVGELDAVQPRLLEREHEALLGLAPLGIAVERRDDRAAVATAHGGGDDFLVVGAAQGNCRLPLIEDGKRVERAFDHVEGGRIERARVVEGQRAELVGARDGVLLLGPAGDVAVDVEVLASHVWDRRAACVRGRSPGPISWRCRATPRASAGT